MSKNKKLDSGAEAFEAVRAGAEAVGKERLLARGINYDDAASRMLGVLDAMEKDPTLNQRLRRLPKDDLPPAHLDALPILASALAYASRQAKTEEATSSDALVPLSLVEGATTIRARQMDLVTYYLRRHEVYGPEIVDIRAGTGHLDLAMDIDRLTAMIVKNRALLEKDPVNFRASDLVEGPQAATAIRTAYNAQSNGVWSDRARRVYALLDEHYAEVRAAAQFVFRHEPATLGVFIALRPHGGARLRKEIEPAPPAPVPAPGGGADDGEPG